jgi:hypothetical protein
MSIGLKMEVVRCFVCQGIEGYTCTCDEDGKRFKVLLNKPKLPPSKPKSKLVITVSYRKI